MAFTQEINGLLPATGAVAMWAVIATIVAAGGSVLADSDGTTYNASGGQVTSGASSAGGLGNTNAWVRVRTVGGHEFTIQRGTTNLVWRIKYSQSAGFSGGTPSASQTPTATDQAIRCGGGTDASPTFLTLFPTDATSKLYGCADSSNGEFYFFNRVIAGGAQSGGIIFTLSTGGDSAAALIVAVAGSSFAAATIGNTGATALSSGTMAWLYYGTGSAAFVAMPAVGAEGFPNDSGQDGSGNYLIRYVEFSRKLSLGGTTGNGGKSPSVCWNATSRVAGELYLVGGSSYRITAGDVNLPFVSSVVL